LEKRESQVMIFENYAETHYESGVTEEPLPFSKRLQAKLLGAHRAFGFSDGSIAMHVIYRNFFRPPSDYVCKLAIYDESWNLHALIPSRMYDSPISLTEYKMSVEKEKNDILKTILNDLSENVRVHETKPSFRQILQCATHGYDSIATFSDKSMGATLKYYNQLVPGQGSFVEMGFVLDNKWNELARYHHKKGNRLISRKEHEYIVMRLEREKNKPEIVVKDRDFSITMEFEPPSKRQTSKTETTAEPTQEDEIKKRFKQAKNYANFTGTNNISRIK
jgi:hypothetical protein